MIILDILSYNLSSVLLFSAPLMVFDLTDSKLYFTLIMDIVFNGIPFCTIILILLYFLNNQIIKYVTDGVWYRFVVSILYLMIYAITIFSIFNKFSFAIVKLVFNILPVNIILNVIVIFLRRGHTLK